jgi:hypothetical protein
MLVDEHILPDGSVSRVHLTAAGDRVLLQADGAPRALPLSALAAVMRRYGRPLEAEVAPAPDDAVLDFPDGSGLRRFAFRAAVDAAARDYLLWIEPGREPLAALATSIAAALAHLARRVGAPP